MSPPLPLATPCPPTQPGYARELPWYRRRRPRRWLLTCLLAALGVAAGRLVPVGWGYARAVYCQQRCLTYAAPPDQVVYEDDPVEAAGLLAIGRDYLPCPMLGDTPAAAVHVPPPWAGSPAWHGPPHARAVLYLHERRSPGGNRRLVAIQFLGKWAGTDDGRYKPVWTVNPVVTVPSAARPFSSTPQPAPAPANSRFRDPMAGIVWVARPFLERRVRFFAGQSDPADPSHFTVGFEADGRKGTIDGWLRDDDKVQLRVRD